MYFVPCTEYYYYMTAKSKKKRSAPNRLYSVGDAIVLKNNVTMGDDEVKGRVKVVVESVSATRYVVKARVVEALEEVVMHHGKDSPFNVGDLIVLNLQASGEYWYDTLRVTHNDGEMYYGVRVPLFCVEGEYSCSDERIKELLAE